MAFAPTRPSNPLVAAFVLLLVTGLVLVASGGGRVSASPAVADRPAGVSQEPGYRDGQRIGGGGAAEPSSASGTITFFLSSAAVIGLITGGILLGRRSRRKQEGHLVRPAETHRTEPIQEPAP